MLLEKIAEAGAVDRFDGRGTVAGRLGHNSSWYFETAAAMQSLAENMGIYPNLALHD